MHEHTPDDGRQRERTGETPPETDGDGGDGTLPLTKRGLLRAAAATSLVPSLSGLASAQEVSVGNGSYVTTVPSGEGSPQDTQYTTANVSAPIPTNDWWSTLLWFQYSNPMFAHPIAATASGAGLDVSNPTDWNITSSGVTDGVAMMDDSRDLTIGHSATSSFSDTRCDGYGDWHTVAKWGDGTSTTLTTTISQGSPYVFAEYEGGGAVVSFPSTPTVFADDGNVLGVEIDGHAYGLYAPSGATWSGQGTTELTSTLNGAGYLTVAALPEATSTALSELETYAYNFIRDSTVSWSYDQSAGEVTTTFDVTTENKAESGATGSFLGLFPHQHKYASASFTPYTYTSARGPMKTISGTSSFQVTYTFPGVLPFLPDEGSYDSAELASYVDEEESNRTLVETGPDSPGDGTYWTGKNYGRLAELIPIAEQVGDTTAADYFLNGDQNTLGLRDDLELWLDASQEGSTRSEDVFYYDQNWGTLVGYNDSFGSGANINDHHFHYGYYVRGAAEIARNDRTWAQDANWGSMVRLLVRDFANWERPDRSNTQSPASNPKDSFPFLRNFSPYEGHSWADGGGADFADGNNQESSSEAINAYASMILWGEYTGDTALRDAGVFLYTTEVHAVQEYWFDVDDTNQPSNWAYDTAAMVWGDGYKYDTFFTTDVEAIHGINFLPLAASSSYLGWDVPAAEANYTELVNNDPDGDSFQYWPDIHWMFRALSDVADAKNLWTARKDSYPVEFGESRAHTYHWIYNTDAMGTAVKSITADHPLTTVYDDGSSKTYVAYNPSSSSTTVTFSDGTSLSVPANSMATSSDGDGGGSGSASTVESLSASEVETSTSDAAFDVSWSVSDGDGDLSSVDLTLTDETAGTTDDTATSSVSGSSASGTTRLVAPGDDGSGNDYTVGLTVTDAAGNTTSDSTTVTESESTSSGGPTVDTLSVAESAGNDPHADFTVDWAVSDSDTDLSTVDLTLTDTTDGAIEDTVSIGVGGGSAADQQNLRANKAENDGHTYEVELVVADAAGNTTSATATEVEDGA
ncbi:glycosyl hydrolase [Salinirubrum litoreum]|uniref:glucan endo-1,3-beta-D-glucosidase n=1 Tax=Salinirubrum litoreum TaxID=1126234 RepID=A0ABD5RG37_9EURY|nr:glycosyl hydrolase [Salinirubrum litoreum]